MRTVIQMLEEAAEKFADRPYLSGKTAEGWKDVSFSEADKASDEIAAWCLKAGMERGARVGLIAEGRPEWIIGEMAMLKAGLVSVPMSLKLQAEEIPFRGDSAEVYAEALVNLAGRDWVEGMPDGYRTTEKGQALRQEAEEATDRYFFAPWACLSVIEKVQLHWLLTQLKNNLQEMVEDKGDAT